MRFPDTSDVLSCVGRYRVQIHGTNFLVNVEGRVAKRGFLTYRLVEAPDAAQAESAAIESVRTTQSLRNLVHNAPDDPPIMEVEELAELDDNDLTAETPTALIWYEDPSKPWWQFWR